jgi:hypothetical protein
MEVWSDRVRDRHVVSVQAAWPDPQPPGQSQRAKRVLGTGVIRVFACWRVPRRQNNLELLEQLELLE